MLDRCFAPWRAADVIANDDHAPEQTGEFPPAGVHAHELAVLRPRVQPTDEHGSLVRGHEVPGGPRRDGADSREPCRLLAGLEQTARLHDEVDLRGHSRRGLLPGQPLDQQVGGDLGLRPALRLSRGKDRLRRFLQVRKSGHRLGHRQQGREVGHVPGGRAHADRALPDPAFEVLDRSTLIEFLGQCTRFVCQPPDPDLGKASGHPLIELVLLLARQPVGFLGHDPRLLLGDVAGLHRPIGLGQVQKQGARELQQSVAARAGDLSGQSDLRAEPAALFLAGHSVLGLSVPAEHIEAQGLPSLGRRAGRVQFFQGRDAVDGLFLGLGRGKFGQAAAPPMDLGENVWNLLCFHDSNTILRH